MVFLHHVLHGLLQFFERLWMRQLFLFLFRLRGGRNSKARGEKTGSDSWQQNAWHEALLNRIFFRARHSIRESAEFKPFCGAHRRPSCSGQLTLPRLSHTMRHVALYVTRRCQGSSAADEIRSRTLTRKAEEG